MKVVVGADHAGYQLKMAMGEFLRSLGHEVLDVGAYDEKASDYPDFADMVGRAVLDGKSEPGVLICGSGVGASVSANKLRGIRAGMGHDTYSAHQGVEHDDIHILDSGAGLARAWCGPGPGPGQSIHRGQIYARGASCAAAGQSEGHGREVLQ